MDMGPLSLNSFKTFVIHFELLVFYRKTTVCDMLISLNAFPVSGLTFSQNIPVHVPLAFCVLSVDIALICIEKISGTVLV